MKRISCLIAMIFLLSVGIVNAKDLQTVKIGYVAEPAHGLFFLAKEKGFFKEEGINAELYEFTSGAEGFNALTTGKLDVATFGSTGPLFYISKGADFTIFGGIMIEGQAMLVRPENYDYFKSKDLKVFKGKKIGYIHTTEAEYIFKDALTKAGIDYKKDITWVELDSPTAVTEAVNKGLVDVGFSWPPNYSLAVKNYGLKIPHYFAEYKPRYTCCRLTATTKQVAENPEKFKKFLVAILRAYDYYKTHEDETVKIYTKYLKIDEAIVRNETYNDRVAESDPDPLKGTLNDIWSLIVKAGDAPADLKIDWDKRVNVAIYKQALDEVIKRYPNSKTYKEALARYKKYQ